MSLGVALVVAAGALVSPLIGRAVDRGSPRAVMLTGAALLTSGLVALSQAPSLGWAAVAWVGLVGPGQAALGAVPAMTMVANWFVARRGTMVAIAALGIPFGGFIVPPIVEGLIRGVGWRGALLWMGLAAFALAVPIVWLGVRKSPEEIGAHPDGAAEAPPEEVADEDAGTARAILSDRRFWPVAGAFASLVGFGIAFSTHIMPIASEKGVGREIAVALMSAMSVGSALGKLFFGGLTDGIGPRRALFIGVVIQMLAWGGLILSDGPILFGLSSFSFAFGIACTIPVQAGLLGLLFGRAQFGRATGLIGLFSLVGLFGFAPLIGWGYDVTGSYDVPMMSALGAIALPALLLGFVSLEPAKSAAPKGG